jgi:hypothetical protein
MDRTSPDSRERPEKQQAKPTQKESPIMEPTKGREIPNVVKDLPFRIWPVWR